MLYIPSLRLCYLHIPKTAGTWVRMAVRGSGLYASEYGREFEHANLARARDSLADDIEYFATVRHPFAWLRSYWVDRQLKGWGGDLQIGIHCRIDDFERFVRTICNLRRGYLTELFETYIGPCMKPAVTVLRSETVNQSLRELIDARTRSRGVAFATLTGIDSLQPLNLGAAYPAFHEKTEGHPELWELVRQSEPKIYEAFGYDVAPPLRVAV